MTDFGPPVAFPAKPDSPAIQIHVNFGILAGREATPAEIEELARTLTELVEPVTIVSEQHYEVGRGHEAVVHLVRIQVDDGALADADLQELSRRLVDAAARWAERCAAERHADL
jgi:hypothetical protein